MALKIKDLPKTVFVKIEKDDNADWLNAAQRMSDHAEMGDQVRVGIYKLESVHIVQGVVESQPVKRRR